MTTTSIDFRLSQQDRRLIERLAETTDTKMSDVIKQCMNRILIKYNDVLGGEINASNK